MTRRSIKFYRKIGPWLTAGVLLQAGGCMFDPTSVTNGLIAAVVNQFIGGLVFGTFNLTP